MTSPEPAPSTHRTVQREEPERYAGKYSNPTFGYTVLIPQGFTGKGELEGQPQHGFTIDLSAEDRAILSVDGSYNAPLWNSLDEVYKDHFRYTSNDAGSVTVIEKKATLMDTLPAMRFTIQYLDQKTRVARIRTEIMSIRKCPAPAVQVVNTIILGTTESRFGEDRVLIERVLASWKMIDTCR